MIARCVVRKWTADIDGSICELMSHQHDLFDFVESVLDQWMKPDRALRGSLSVALRGIRDLELDVLNRVRRESSRHLERLPLIEDVVETPSLGSERCGIAHFAAHRC